MQIKAADNKGPQIAALEALLKRPNLRTEAKKRIELELRTTAVGAKTERDAAYQIEFHCGGNPNVMTIHDLRIECDSRVAQIDHLVMNRLLEVYVCESKSFSGGVSVNEQGEWSAYYEGEPRGIASPIEQNQRHAAVLRDVFTKGHVKLPKRLGLTLMPEIRALVLLSNNARLRRPRRQVIGLESVIKADQLISTIDRAVDAKLSRAIEHGNVSALLSIGKAVSSETLQDLARQLAGLHKPITVDWAARFGLSPEPTKPQPITKVWAVCASCQRKVSDKVAEFCKANGIRFANKILCWDCQQDTPTTSRH